MAKARGTRAADLEGGDAKENTSGLCRVQHKGGIHKGAYATGGVMTVSCIQTHRTYVQLVASIASHRAGAPVLRAGAGVYGIGI
jgi:hypothetical protein